MGADAPIPPLTIDTAAPDGAPPRRFNYRSTKKNFAPPCLGEALRRGPLTNNDHFNDSQDFSVNLFGSYAILALQKIQIRFAQKNQN